MRIDTVLHILQPKPVAAEAKHQEKRKERIQVIADISSVRGDREEKTKMDTSLHTIGLHPSFLCPGSPAAPGRSANRQTRLEGMNHGGVLLVDGTLRLGARSGLGLGGNFRAGGIQFECTRPAPTFCPVISGRTRLDTSQCTFEGVCLT